MNTVNCEMHGKQEESFVCQHIVLGLRDGKPYGFHWPSNSDEKRPSAWCTDCNELVQSQNWEWTDKVLDFSQVKLLCGACYDDAKLQNGF